MDLSLSPAEREFRDAVRDWIEANHPGREPDSDPELFEFRRAWQRALNDRGWAGLTWPTEYGGAGATQVEQAIFFEEVARAGAPSMANVLGLAMGGPTVIAHGTEEQKQRYLTPILSADEIWCQGFSEPESGSDLASLKTRAVRNGDEWIVTGQKVWTTYAHEAKWCMLVARTDQEAPKHRGLDLLPARHGAGGRRGPPARADHRRVRVQRAVPRGGPDPAREHRRRRGQRLAGGDHHAHARARGAGLRAPGARPGRAARAARRDPRGGAGRRPADPPALRPARRGGARAAPQRLPRADGDDEARRARRARSASGSGPRSTSR